MDFDFHPTRVYESWMRPRDSPRPEGRAVTRLQSSFHTARRRWAGWLALLHLGALVPLGLYFLLAAIEGGMYHYSFLYEARPPDPAAATAAVLGYGIFAVVAATIIYFVFFAMLAYALDTVSIASPSVGRALHRSLPAAARNAWWGVPTAAILTVGGFLVLPAALLPIVAAIGFSRLSGSRARFAFATHIFWRGIPVAMGMCILAVLGLAALTDASDRTHFYVAYVVLLAAWGWAMFVILGFLAAAFTMACASHYINAEGFGAIGSSRPRPRLRQ